MRLRSSELNLARAPLALMVGIGLVACSPEKDQPPPVNPNPVAVLPIGATAKLTIGYRCAEGARSTDGTCTKGGPDIREVKVCTLPTGTVLILEPSEFQGEATIGDNVGQVSPPHNDEAFPSCL